MDIKNINEEFKVDLNTDELVMYFDGHKRIYGDKLKGIHVHKNGKHGYISKEGEVIIPWVYDVVCCYDDEFGGFLVEKCGKWGHLNEKGEEIIPCKYDRLWVKNGFTIAKEGGKWGIISNDNKELLPTIYQKISYDRGSNECECTLDDGTVEIYKMNKICILGKRKIEEIIGKKAGVRNNIKENPGRGGSGENLGSKVIKSDCDETATIGGPYGK